MSGPLRLDSALDLLEAMQPSQVAGRVTELTGLVLRATAPGAKVGELVTVHRADGARALQAEVVGFRGGGGVLPPLGAASGVGPDSIVRPTGRAFAIRCGPALLGRVLDGLGEPI